MEMFSCIAGEPSVTEPSTVDEGEISVTEVVVVPPTVSEGNGNDTDVNQQRYLF